MGHRLAKIAHRNSNFHFAAGLLHCNIGGLAAEIKSRHGKKKVTAKWNSVAQLRRLLVLANTKGGY
jgi:hypothetical protein